LIFFRAEKMNRACINYGMDTHLYQTVAPFMHIRDFWSFIFARASISRDLFARDIAVVVEARAKRCLETMSFIQKRAAARGCTVMLSHTLDSCETYHNDLASLAMRACKHAQLDVARMLFAREDRAIDYACIQATTTMNTRKRSLAYYGFIGACKGGHIELLDAICSYKRADEDIAEHVDCATCDCALGREVYDLHAGHIFHSYGTAGNLAALCYNNARVREYFASCGEKYGPILNDEQSYPYISFNVLLKTRDFAYFRVMVAHERLSRIRTVWLLEKLVRKEAYYGEDLISNFIDYMYECDSHDMESGNEGLYLNLSVILPQSATFGSHATHMRVVYHASRTLSPACIMTIANYCRLSGSPSCFCTIMHRYGANKLSQAGIDDLFAIGYNCAPNDYYEKILAREPIFCARCYSPQFSESGVRCAK